MAEIGPLFSSRFWNHQYDFISSETGRRVGVRKSIINYRLTDGCSREIFKTNDMNIAYKCIIINC